MLQRQKMESTNAPTPMEAMFSQRNRIVSLRASTLRTTSGKVSAMNHTLTMSALKIMFMSAPLDLLNLGLSEDARRGDSLMSLGRSMARRMWE